MRVLLVDDTKTLPSLVQIYLMGWSLEFTVAADGLEGLGKFQAENPDLVITDVRMPRMDGFELCAAIRADSKRSSTPVVLLTSFGDEAAREKGRLVGATEFLQKPITVEALRGVVAKLLRLPEARR